MFELGRPLQAAVVQSKGREKPKPFEKPEEWTLYSLVCPKALWMLDSQSELRQSDTEYWLMHDTEQYFSGGTVAECCDLTLTSLSSSNVLGEADEP